MVELVILLFVVLAVACFGLLLPTVVIILAASYLLTFALCRVPMLRARLQDSRRGGAA